MDKARQEKRAISDKIAETYKDTERLKQELQALISAGIRGRDPVVFQNTQPIQQQHAEQQAVVSPKKPKTYDVEDTRKYIKKQRERWGEEHRGRKTASQVKIEAELRREKLKELQQKASEIVYKNVSAKRSRSRSRSKEVDRSAATNKVPNRTQGGNLKEPVCPNLVSHQPHLLQVPETKYGLGSMPAQPPLQLEYREATSAIVKDVSKTSSGHLHLPKTDLKNPQDLVPSEKSNSQKGVALVFAKQSARTKATPQSTLSKSTTSTTTRATRDSHNLSQDHNVVFVQEDFQNLCAQKPPRHRHKEKINILSNITLRSPSDPIDSSKAESPTKHQPVEKLKIISSNAALRSDSVSPMPEELKQQVPEWLKERPQTDPYNFMNTVKRQLKYVIDEGKPSSVDVAVQGDLPPDSSHASSSSKSSKKTDLKSFISHKCLNLDLKSIENKRLFVSKDGPTITKPSDRSDNGSDTSKNIPSISSESLVSDLRLLEAVGAPVNLDAQRVEDVRLSGNEKNSLLSVPGQEEVQRIKKQLFRESHDYSSDFGETTDLDQDRSAKSRNSIVSSNCAKVSPNRVPVVMPKTRENSPELHTDILSADSHRRLTSSKKRPDSSESMQKFHSLVSTLRGSTRASAESQTIPEKPFSLLSEAHQDHSFPESLPPLTIASETTVGSSRDPSKKSETVSFKKRIMNDGLLESLGLSTPNVSETTKLTTESGSEVLGRRSGTGSFDTVSDVHKNGKAWNYSEDFEVKSSQKISSEVISEAIKSKESTRKSEIKKVRSILSKSEAIIHEDKENIEGPKLSLNITKRTRKADQDDRRQSLMRNITIRSGDGSFQDNNASEVHLKFEAEIHLLTDFNESIRRFSEIEKAFESLRVQNTPEKVTRKVLQDRDTQTSVVPSASPTMKSITQEPSRQQNHSSTTISIAELNSDPPNGDLELQLTARSEVTSENIFMDLTQASDLNSALSTVNFDDTLLDKTSKDTSSVLQFSQLDLDGSRRATRAGPGDENGMFRSVVGMSLRMFDQMIKDEDARIENWKKVVRIREQALLDRTRGELVWLEMQKKQLIETGKLTEASLIKKKQRGILLKHQQEKHEMQRLKQMQKEDSQNRKTLLKKERNQIKKQLFSGTMSSKLKPGSHRDRSDRRLSGPFKVLQASETTLRSEETSLSKGTAGTDQEIKSITTRTSRTHSVVNIVSESSDHFNSDLETIDLTLRGRTSSVGSGGVANMKKTLLMREHALARRRKTVEELLQWHTRLLDEEKAIGDLESKIATIISKIPNSKSTNNEKATTEKTTRHISVSAETSASPTMSQLVVLERLQPPPVRLPSRTPPPTSIASSEPSNKNIPQEVLHSEDSSNLVVSSANYSTDFDIEESSPPKSDDQSSVSSISQLIEDFNKIEDNILHSCLMPVTKKPTAIEDEIIVPPQEDAKSEVSSHSLEAVSQFESREVESDQDASVIIVEDSVIVVEEPSEQLESNTDRSSVIKRSAVEIQEVLDEDASGKDIVGFTNENEGPIEHSVPISDIANDGTSSGNAEDRSTAKESIEINDKRETIIVEVLDDTAKTSAEQSNDAFDEVASENLVDNTSSRQESVEELEHSKDLDILELHVSEDAPIGSILEDAEVPKISEGTHLSLSPSAAENKSPIISLVDEEPQLQLEEPSATPSKDDVSTSKQLEEIEDLPGTSSNAEQPSTSRQNTGSPVQSLSSKEDISNLSEEKDHDSLSTPSSSPSAGDVESPQLPSVVVEDDRQSFENKTDEEKAASLSVRSSVSGRSKVRSERLAQSLVEDESHQSSTSASADQSLLSFNTAGSGDRVASIKEETSKVDAERIDTEQSPAVDADISSIISEISAVEDASKASSSKDSITDVTEGSSSTNEEDKSTSVVQSASRVATISPEEVASTTASQQSSPSSEKSTASCLQKHSPSKSSVDIRNYVLEILGVTSPTSRGDKSPRMQDLCLMTYDTSPTQSPESGSPMDENKPFSLGTEAEELHKKQLAIEQEIKLLKEQQQKEAGSPFYIREIPNKPPPPYTPPSKAKAPKTPSVVPGNKEEVEQITEYSAKIIHKAYLSGNLDTIQISDNTLNLIAKKIDKGCYKYVFDLCKEVAKEHYGQFVEEAGPSWLQLDKKPQLAPQKPLDVNGLKKLMSKRLLVMFGFEKQETKRENAIMKWSRKKRDHVDEVLVQDMQAEEVSWTNFDRDEALVKDRITNEIMEMLLKETVLVLKQAVQKKDASQ